MMTKTNGKFFYAIDPAMGNTGVAIFNEKMELVHMDRISTENKKKFKRDEPFEFGERLGEIYDRFMGLREEYPPYDVSIERGFSRFNKPTQVIFRAHGVINLIFKDVPLYYYTPKEVKNTIWSGNAEKEEIMEVIEARLKISVGNKDDISDAIAVGITHMSLIHGYKWSKTNKLTRKDIKAKEKADANEPTSSKSKSKTATGTKTTKPKKKTPVKKTTAKKTTKLKPLKRNPS